MSLPLRSNEARAWGYGKGKRGRKRGGSIKEEEEGDVGVGICRSRSPSREKEADVTGREWRGVGSTSRWVHSKAGQRYGGSTEWHNGNGRLVNECAPSWEAITTGARTGFPTLGPLKTTRLKHRRIYTLMGAVTQQGEQSATLQQNKTCELGLTRQRKGEHPLRMKEGLGRFVP